MYHEGYEHPCSECKQNPMMTLGGLCDKCNKVKDKKNTIFTDADIMRFAHDVNGGTDEGITHAFDSIKGFLIFHSLHNECFIHNSAKPC